MIPGLPDTPIRWSPVTSAGQRMELELFLTRHGETRCSRQGIFCGDCDSGLTPIGRQMAERVAAAMAGRGLNAVISSPAPRAVQTAQVIREIVVVPCVREPRLAEMRFGQWEGLTTAAVADTGAHEAWQNDPVMAPPPGGETGAAVLARATAALWDLGQQHPRGRLLVVSHKHVIRLLLAYAGGLSVKAYRAEVAAPVGSVSTLRLDHHGLSVVDGADISHLSGMQREELA